MTGSPEAPVIDGLTVMRHLGTGGYSEVWECQQDDNTKLRVAVKVLSSAGISDLEREQFAIEAETMAQLAGHPYIVQVSRTGTTNSGLPYLVMKLYPKPNLAEQAASRRISVEEALRIGVNLSSAVETAHRCGFLHRDIKPANVLIDQYDEPGLADFGIAGKSSDTEDDDDLGVSVPWSPPEVLGGTSNGSVASDVYSLGATLWHVLAGRSPFEIPGGDNQRKVLMGRILRAPAPSTGRPDVPESLNRLLQQALAKKPELRPKSALEFARALQQAQQSLRLERTKITVSDVRTPAEARPGDAPTEESSGSAQSRRPTAAPPPGSPATTIRPMRARPTVGGSADGGGSSTTVRPMTPAVQARQATTAAPGTARRPVAPTSSAAPGTARRPFSPAPVADTSGFAPPLPVATPTQSDNATRARARRPVPITAMPEELAPAGKPRKPEESSTVRRPVSPTEPAPGVNPKRKRMVSTPVAASFGVAVVVVAVVVGVIVSSGGHAAAPAGKPPKQPVGSDAGGFVNDGVTPPTVTATYQATSHVLTFSWRGTGGGAAGPFTFSLNGGAPVGPTKATEFAVTTSTPTTDCISVAALSSDGTQHLASPVCGG